MDQSHGNQWLKNLESELFEIRGKLDRLYDQGRSDISLNLKADEIQKIIDNYKRLFNEKS